MRQAEDEFGLHINTQMIRMLNGKLKMDIQLIH